MSRRVTFRLNQFLEGLEYILLERTDLIDDHVQFYKDFLSHASDDIRGQVKSYMDLHPLVSGNQEIRSYVDACHRPYFEV